MHELSVCRALLAQVTRIAQRHHANTVLSVTLRIGPLSGVDIDLLEIAFDAARQDTVADQATLNIERSNIQLTCLDCRATNETTPNRLTCIQCGSEHTRLLSGDEMLILSVELNLDPEDLPCVQTADAASSRL